MLNGLKEQLRAFAHRKLDGTDRKKLHPVALHALNFASIVNELAGRPIRGADEVGSPATPASSGSDAPGSAPGAA